MQVTIYYIEMTLLDLNSIAVLEKQQYHNQIDESQKKKKIRNKPLKPMDLADKVLL